MSAPGTRSTYPETRVPIDLPLFEVLTPLPIVLADYEPFKVHPIKIRLRNRDSVGSIRISH